MSGGSHDYICYKIENELSGQMKDAELNELIDDIVELTHDLEWAESGDTNIEDYFETVKKFKQKWFKADRNKRLERMINEKLQSVRNEMLALIGA